MPKCSRCPIKTECNQNPILVTREQKKPKFTARGRKSEPVPAGEVIEKVKVRLCPLLIAIGHAVKTLEPPKISAVEGTEQSLVSAG